MKRVYLGTAEFPELPKKPDRVPGEIVITFKQGTPRETMRTVLDLHGGIRNAGPRIRCTVYKASSRLFHHMHYHCSGRKNTRLCRKGKGKRERNLCGIKCHLVSGIKNMEAEKHFAKITVPDEKIFDYIDKAKANENVKDATVTAIGYPC